MLENREEGFGSKQKMFTTVLEGFRNFEKNRNVCTVGIGGFMTLMFCRYGRLHDTDVL